MSEDPIEKAARLRREDDEKLADFERGQTRLRRELTARELEFYFGHINNEIMAKHPPRTDQEKETLDTARMCASAGLEHARIGDYERAAFELSRTLWHYAVPEKKKQEIEAQRGRDFSTTQAEKGAKGAESRWKDGERRAEIDSVIQRLAQRRDELGDHLPPAELWPELYSEIEAAGLPINDHSDSYTIGDTEITLAAFRRRIQRERQS